MSTETLNSLITNTEILSPEKAIQLTLKIDKYDEVLHVYESWAKILFQQYGSETISESDLKSLLELFFSAIEKLIITCSDCADAVQISKLTNFLNCSLELFAYIKSVPQWPNEISIRYFLLFGVSVIHCLVNFVSKQKCPAVVHPLIEKILTIHSHILCSLNFNHKSFCFDKTDDDLLINLMSNLCAIGEETTKLDIKTAVETWKIITRLATRNSSHSRNQSIKTVTWLNRPLSFLLNEISRNVKTVYKENSLSEPIKQIERYLKVTHFFMKLLQTLIEDFCHLSFPVCEDFIKTLSIILNPPEYIVGSPVYVIVMEYVVKDFVELIPFAYQDKLFLEMLLNEKTDLENSNNIFYPVLIEVIKAATRKNEAEQFNDKFIDTLFDKTKCTNLFACEKNYNSYIEAISAMQVQFNLKAIQNKLIAMILQEDILIALQAIDVWSAIFSASNSNTRLLYFAFWNDLNDKFAMFSNQRTAFHVALLIKSLYNLQTSQEKSIHFNELTKPSNKRFLLTIGLNNVPNGPKKNYIIKQFENEWENLLTNNEMNLNTYYTIVKMIKLLTPIQCQSEKLINKVCEYLEIAIKNGVNYYLLIESILDFVSPRTNLISERKILPIANLLKANIPSFTRLSTKLSMLTFFKNISEVFEFQNCENILTSLEKQLTEITSEKVESNEIEVNHELIMTILKQRNSRKTQKCDEVCNESFQLEKKRIKTETELLIESIENSVIKLQARVQNDELTSSNKEVIKRVVHKLQQIR